MHTYAQAFPKIGKQGVDHDQTSPKDGRYNCIAYAAGDYNNWWEPCVGYTLIKTYWPPNAPREYTLGAFIAAYSTRGFVTCKSKRYERGYEKIALYGLNGDITHAAKQLPNGFWASKLGPEEDIYHRYDGLEGSEYGRIVQIMKRRADGVPIRKTLIGDILERIISFVLG
jgi:hypothetical protein